MKRVIDFHDRKRIEEQAAEWLIRLDGDSELSLEERQRLEGWLARSSAHRDELFRLAELWSDLNVLSELAVSLDCRAQEYRSRWLRPFPLATAAAGVVVAIGLAVLFVAEPQIDTNGLYATAVGQQNVVALSDGSAVNLNTDTQIRVHYDGEFRDVTLIRGEAHFSVADDPDIPFRVSAAGGRIVALGTAFSVYLRDGSVDVTVSDGVVALEIFEATDFTLAMDLSEPLETVEPLVRELGTLSAGQVATISTITDNLVESDNLQNIGTIEPPELLRRLSWTDGVLSFSGEPLEEVVREISRYTTVEIEFAAPEVRSIRIGGRFPVGETETMFEALENIFGLSVTYTSEGQVLISAGG